MEGKVKLQGQATGREDERTTGRQGQSRPSANIVSGTRVKMGGWYAGLARRIPLEAPTTIVEAVS